MMANPFEAIQTYQTTLGHTLEELRQRYEVIWNDLVREVPECFERKVAERHLELAMFWTIQAITRGNSNVPIDSEVLEEVSPQQVVHIPPATEGAGVEHLGADGNVIPTDSTMSEAAVSAELDRLYPPEPSKDQPTENVEVQ